MKPLHNHIDEIARNSLKNYSVTPPEDIWKGIEKDLSVNKRVKRFKLILVFSISAVLVFTVGFFAFNYINTNDNNAILDNTQQIALNQDNTLQAETGLRSKELENFENKNNYDNKKITEDENKKAANIIELDNTNIDSNLKIKNLDSNVENHDKLGKTANNITKEKNATQTTELKENNTVKEIVKDKTINKKQSVSTKKTGENKENINKSETQKVKFLLDNENVAIVENENDRDINNSVVFTQNNVQSNIDDSNVFEEVPNNENMKKHEGNNTLKKNNENVVINTEFNISNTNKTVYDKSDSSFFVDNEKNNFIVDTLKNKQQEPLIGIDSTALLKPEPLPIPDDYVKKNPVSLGVLYGVDRYKNVLYTAMTYTAQDNMLAQMKVDIELNKWHIQAGMGYGEGVMNKVYQVLHNDCVSVGSYRELDSISFDVDINGVDTTIIPNYYTRTVNVYDTMLVFKNYHQAVKTKWLHIPVLAGYKYNVANRLSLLIQGGVIYSYCINANEVRKELLLNDYFYGFETQEEKTRPLKTARFMFTSQIAVMYKLHTNVSVGLEPRFNYAISDFYKIDEDIDVKKPYSIGCLVGFYVHF